MTEEKYSRFRRLYDFDLASYTAPTDVQIFTTPGNATWIKPANADTVTVILIGGGGGGGSGARRASGTATSGGNGGTGGGMTTLTFSASDINSTEAISVGAGGAGGAAVTVDNTNGNAGAGASPSTFGTSRKGQANGGGGGNGGSTSTTSSNGGGAGQMPGGNPGLGVVGNVGNAGGRGVGSGGGGSAGGGISTTPAAFAGSAGGLSLMLGDVQGAAGAINGSGGNGQGATNLNHTIGGAGGGGGGASITAAGGKGGDGGRHGGGGGGGGNSLNGFNSGAGGKGADGIVVVYTKCLSTATTINGPVQQPKMAPGKYYFTGSPTGGSTSNALGVGTLRVHPWIVTDTITVTKIGAEVTAVGDAGSKFRLGIYLDDGFGKPAARILDAGQIAGDVVGPQEVTVNITLPPNIYWIGGAVQSVTTNQPTMRILSGTWHVPVIINAGTATPGANASVLGLLAGSITGILPASFGASSSAGMVVRTWIKVE